MWSSLEIWERDHLFFCLCSLRLSKNMVQNASQRQSKVQPWCSSVEIQHSYKARKSRLCDHDFCVGYEFKFRLNCLPEVWAVTAWAGFTFWFCRVWFCKELNILNETALCAISKWGKGKIKTWLFPLTIKWRQRMLCFKSMSFPLRCSLLMKTFPLKSPEPCFWRKKNRKKNFIKLLFWNWRNSFICFSASQNNFQLGSSYHM